MTERIATAYKLASFPGTWKRGYDPITSTSASVDRLSARCCLNAQCRDGVTGKKKQLHGLRIGWAMAHPAAPALTSHIHVYTGTHMHTLNHTFNIIVHVQVKSTDLEFLVRGRSEQVSWHTHALCNEAHSGSARLIMYRVWLYTALFLH